MANQPIWARDKGIELEGDRPYAENPVFANAAGRASNTSLRKPSVPLTEVFPWKNSFFFDIECLGGNTLVEDDRGGIIPIQEVVENTTNIEVSRQVSTMGKTIALSPVLHKTYKGIKHVWLVKSEYGLPIIASDKHLFFTQRGWVFTKDLTTEDYLLVRQSSKEHALSKYTDEELALIGWFIAEGCRQSDVYKGSVRLSIAEQEYEEWIRNYANIDPEHLYLTPINSSLTVGLHLKRRGRGNHNKAKALLVKLGLLDKYSWEKAIPQCVLQSDNRQIALLLKCIFSGDGTVFKDRAGLSLCTTSNRLAEQVVILLRRFGIVATLSSRQDNRKASYKDCYIVQICGCDAKIFYNEVGFIGKKQDELAQTLRLYPNYHLKSRIPTIWSRELIKTILSLGYSISELAAQFGSCVLNVHYNHKHNLTLPVDVYRQLASISDDPVLTPFYKVASPGFLWSSINKLIDEGTQPVWDLSVNTHEFIANLAVVHNTTDLSRHSSITEMSLFDPTGAGGKGKYYTWALEEGKDRSLGFIDKEGVYKTTSRQEFASQLAGKGGVEQPYVGGWFKRRAEKGGIYEEFARADLSASDLKRFEQKVTSMTALQTPGSTHSYKRMGFMDAMEDFVGVLESKGGSNKALLAHNAPFDFTRIGETLQAIEKGAGTDAPRATSLMGRFHALGETAPAKDKYRGILFESGEELSKAKMSWARGGSGWRVLRAFGSTEAPSRFAIRDTLTLARTLLTMSFGKQPIGIASMDVLSKAMGMATGQTPQATEAVRSFAHRAAADIGEERKVGEYLWSIASDLSRGKQLAKDKMKFLGILESVESVQATEAYAKNLLEGSAYYNLDGKRLRIPAKAGLDTFGIEAERGGIVQEMRAGQEIIKTEVPFTKRTTPENWSSYQKTVKEFSKRRSYNIDYAAVDKWIASVPLEDTEKMFHDEKLAERILGKEAVDEAWSRGLKAPGQHLRLTQKIGAKDIQQYFKSVMPKNLRKGNAATVVGVSIAAVALMVASSREKGLGSEQTRDIDGMPEQGMSQQLRHINTEFGSGWEGILSSILPPSIMMHSSWSIGDRIERFNRTIWQMPGRRAAMEADIKRRQAKAQSNLGMLDAAEATKVENVEAFEGLNIAGGSELYAMKINPNKYIYEYDDADTLVLQRRGWHGLATGKKMSIRLAGLDAPEVSGHKGDPLKPVRIMQDQPYGRTSSEVFRRLLSSQETLTLVFNPKQKTYGRSIGVLYGDQMQNLNLALVKQGLAAFLPYGEAGSSIIDRQEFKVAEQQAVMRKRGMWQEPFWQTYKSAVQATGMSVTFNTITRIDKLARDRNMTELMVSMWEAQHRGYMSEDHLVEAGQTGNRLRYTYGRFGKHNKKRFSKQIERSRIAGSAAPYNTIPGMQKNTGMAHENRKYFGFGSAFTKGVSEAAETALSNEWRAFKINKAISYNDLAQRKLGKDVFEISQTAKWAARPHETATVEAGISEAQKIEHRTRQAMVSVSVAGKINPEEYRHLAYAGLVKPSKNLDDIARLLDNPPNKIPTAGMQDAINFGPKLPGHSSMDTAKSVAMEQMVREEPAQASVLFGMMKRHDDHAWKKLVAMDNSVVMNHINKGSMSTKLNEATRDAVNIAKAQPTLGGAPSVLITPKSPSIGQMDQVRMSAVRSGVDSASTRTMRNPQMVKGNEMADWLANGPPEMRHRGHTGH